MTTQLIHGDCLEKMREISDGSVDLVLTDPPYGLSFMGKKWDYDVPTVEIWAECLRVLKPGGYLLAFAGTRTQHRMAVRIEDAGFEIRDMIAWVYSTGFPKSLNIYKQFEKMCTCGNMVEYDHERTAQESKHQLRPLQDSNIPKEVTNTTTEREVLQSGVSEQSVLTAILELSNNERREEPSLEGRSNVQTTTRELQGSEVRSLPSAVPSNGEEGRICDGAQIGSSTTPEHYTQARTGSTPQRPQPIKQFTGEPCAFCKQHGAQKIRARASEIYGFGSALKPACEPITVARKPLSEKNLAENVLTHGTGGLNIDGCRVWTDENLGRDNNARTDGTSYVVQKEDLYIDNSRGLGRWPANLIHDGSEEVVGLFPYSKTTAGVKNLPTSNIYGGNALLKSKTLGTGDVTGYSDEGSAARFFYCAKASRRDRGEGNTHATVKPTKLMEYLVTLASREGATILDPFMGSGTTGVACKNLNRNFIGIELDKDYYEIAQKRIGV